MQRPPRAWIGASTGRSVARIRRRKEGEWLPADWSTARATPQNPFWTGNPRFLELRQSRRGHRGRWSVTFFWCKQHGRGLNPASIRRMPRDAWPQPAASRNRNIPSRRPRLKLGAVGIRRGARAQPALASGPNSTRHTDASGGQTTALHAYVLWLAQNAQPATRFPRIRSYLTTGRAGGLAAGLAPQRGPDRRRTRNRTDTSKASTSG